MIQKIVVLFLVLSGLMVIFSAPVLAVCPVCTVAVCAGIGLSRWLKVDDVISGIWIGGLLVSSFLWFLEWLKDKKLALKINTWVIGSLFYFLTLFPLFSTKIIGHPQNKICFFNRIFVDRLLFGIILGNFVFMVGVYIHNLLKRKNNHKSFFPFQKVVLPVLMLLLASLIFKLFK